MNRRIIISNDDNPLETGRRLQVAERSRRWAIRLEVWHALFLSWLMSLAGTGTAALVENGALPSVATGTRDAHQCVALWLCWCSVHRLLSEQFELMHVELLLDLADSSSTVTGQAQAGRPVATRNCYFTVSNSTSRGPSVTTLSS